MEDLFDLTTMAMEYFKEHIEPTLPEITYFGADFLDFASFASKCKVFSNSHLLWSAFYPPVLAPTKRRSVSGSTSIFGGGTGLDSPCSSRASVAGSSVSEAWSSASTTDTGVSGMDMEPGSSGQQPQQSNMVLRKRIRRIRQGMKRYNDQLVEVKKELKGCKSKMESQTKQVHEYSQRLEEYDKKFEESSRKFQTLLTVIDLSFLYTSFLQTHFLSISGTEQVQDWTTVLEIQVQNLVSLTINMCLLFCPSPAFTVSRGRWGWTKSTSKSRHFRDRRLDGSFLWCTKTGGLNGLRAATGHICCHGHAHVSAFTFDQASSCGCIQEWPT